MSSVSLRCSQCRKDHPFTRYSNNQKRKGPDRRCPSCVAESIQHTTHSINNSPALKSLQNSTYLTLYNTIKNKPHRDEIAECLPRQVAANFLAYWQQGLSSGEACARLWTKETIGAYHKVQNAIVLDEAGLLKAWMPFIRRLNYFLIYECQLRNLF